MSTDIVAHFIAGYPDAGKSLEVARGLAEGGAAYLEMQIPFSDPSADGPIIENSCRLALEMGYTVDQAMELLSQLTGELEIPVFLMSYGNIIFAGGMENMVDRAVQAGAAGMIIPDLVYGRDEGLYDLGRQKGMTIVPVITPSVPEERLNEIIALKEKWIYTALRSGITGSYTTLDETNLALLDRLQKAESRVMAGFGIKTAEQVKTLSPHCDAVVAGSVFVQAVTEAHERDESVRTAAKVTIESLLT